MASYKDKHPHTAECSVEWCDSTKTVLRANNGHADWFCSTHDPEAERE